MPKTLTLVFLSFLAALGVAGPAMSQDDLSRDELILPGSSVKLEDFMWIKRPLVVFADSPADPRYVQQMEYITERLDDLDAIVCDLMMPEGSGVDLFDQVAEEHPALTERFIFITGGTFTPKARLRGLFLSGRIETHPSVKRPFSNSNRKSENVNLAPFAG